MIRSALIAFAICFAASTHSDAAKEHYKNGKYLEALEEFQRAHAEAPSPAITFNIARCYERLARWDDALAWYEKFTKEAIEPHDRAETLDKIQFLKNRIAAKDTPFMDAARAAYARGDYKAAMHGFMQAFEVSANPAALYSIAECYRQLHNFGEAREYYRQYLAHYPEAPDRPDVEEEIRRLRPETPQPLDIAVTTKPWRAELYLDTRNHGLIGVTPWRFRAKPGPHTLFIVQNGYETIRHEFVMPNDRDLSLSFELRPLEIAGMLSLYVREDGARIYIDDEIIAIAPRHEMRVLAPGEHEITVEGTGGRTTKKVTIVRDEIISLSF